MIAASSVRDERDGYDALRNYAPAGGTGRGSDDAPTLRLTEAQLTLLWRGRRFPDGALVTRAGVAMRVISEGRAGRGPGPDFRDAAIAGPSGAVVRGDIELHVRSSDFRAHGHHRDLAYRQVVLHVVFEDDDGRDTALPGGRTAPVVALAPWVARRADELQRWLERPPLWREPCHDAVSRLGIGGAAAALNEEGDRRLEAKIARAREAVRANGADQVIYEGMMEALGYGGNAAQMLALARLVPWRAISEQSNRELRGMEALLIGSAGLLPSQRGHAEAIDPYVAELEREFARARAPAMEAGAWKLWGVRPQNSPVRRIAAAAALLARIGHPAQLLDAAAAATASDAISPLLVPATGYWRDHFDVCGPACRLPAALIGRSRALEILVNVVLPIASCVGGESAEAQSHALFTRLPRAANYGGTRFIEAALAADGARVPINAQRAQGLLELRRNWCTRGGCGRCALSRPGVDLDAADNLLGD